MRVRQIPCAQTDTRLPRDTVALCPLPAPLPAALRVLHLRQLLIAGLHVLHVVLHDPPGPCTCTACTGLLDPWASLRPPPVSASHPVMLPVPTAPGTPFLSPLPASAAPHSSPTWPQDSWGGSCPPLTACSLTHSPVHPLARLRAVRAPGRSLCPHPLLPVWQPHPAWQTWYGLSEALPNPRRSRNLTKQPSLYSLRQPYHNDTPW